MTVRPARTVTLGQAHSPERMTSPRPSTTYVPAAADSLSATTCPDRRGCDDATSRVERYLHRRSRGNALLGQSCHDARGSGGARRATGQQHRHDHHRDHHELAHDEPRASPLTDIGLCRTGWEERDLSTASVSLAERKPTWMQSVPARPAQAGGSRPTTGRRGPVALSFVRQRKPSSRHQT